uniref:Pentatricopeptide repeat-containing protein n=1 Tax=Aegilops tauschii TaxID=37682 RepID=M8CP51_AEGTA
MGLNILYDYAAKDLDTWMAKEVLERCEELGFEVDVVTYNTKPITPNAHTYNILISSLCRADNFQLAKFMFSCNGFVADNMTCNILIHKFYDAGKKGELGFSFSNVNAGKIAPHESHTRHKSIVSLGLGGDPRLPIWLGTSMMDTLRSP